MLAVAVVLAASSCARRANAHTRSTSWSTISGGEVTLRLRALDESALLAVFDGDLDAVTEYLTGRLTVSSADGVCSPLGAQPPGRTTPGFVTYRWAIACSAEPTRVSSRLFDEVLPNHLHLATIASTTGAAAAGASAVGASVTVALSRVAPEAALDRPGTASFFAAGWRHILSGWDHLVFLGVLLVGLSALGARRSAVVLAITGFTLGHSITLAAVSLGSFRPDVSGVEALIALTIVVAAAETVWRAQRRRDAVVPAVTLGLLSALAIAALRAPGGSPLALAGVTVIAACLFASPRSLLAAGAAAFGLLHGLGFAGALTELTGGAPRIASLALFNLGVEVGQLAVALAIAPVLVWSARRPWVRDVRIVALTLAAGTGAYWFTIRGMEWFLG